MNKALWSHFKHFGRLLGKTICSSLPPRLIEEFQASKAHLQPATSASFPVVLGDFGCDVTCQACRENYRARFQASSGHSDSANRPGYEAAATWLTGKFPSRPMSRPDTTGKFQPFSAGGSYWHVAHSSCYTRQIASDSMSCLFTSNTFPPRTY